MNWYKKSLKEYEKLKDGEWYLADWKPKEPKEPKQEAIKDVDQAPSDKWIPVESSFISYVAYYETLKIFEIKTIGGHEYGFSGVPKQVFNRFMKSKSKGEFFNKVIKQKYGAK